MLFSPELGVIIQSMGRLMIRGLLKARLPMVQPQGQATPEP